MIYGLLVFLYVIVSVILILVVLLQTGKRADLAGTFGGGGSQSAFGARGAATVLSKTTTASAVLFMLIALTLSVMSRSADSAGTVLDEIAPGDLPAATQPAPADPSSGSLPSLPVDDDDDTATSDTADDQP